MIMLLSKAMMALALGCLGDRRRDWAVAMEAEFDAATAAGNPLGFASGCLLAALRDLPTHEEGRFRIASHAFALLLIVPTAALLLSSLLADFPNSYLGEVGGGGSLHTLHEGNRSAVLPLAALVTSLVAAHLRFAWLVLDRDWARLATTGALIAAAAVTLIIFTALVFASCNFALAHGAALALEFAMILLLARSPAALS